MEKTFPYIIIRHFIHVYEYYYHCILIEDVLTGLIIIRDIIWNKSTGHLFTHNFQITYFNYRKLSEYSYSLIVQTCSKYSYY